MKIRNTAAASSGTTTLHDSECMPDDYTVRFDEDDGTVATVRKEVGEALTEKYASIEVVPERAVPDEGEKTDGSPTERSDTHGSDNE